MENFAFANPVQAAWLESAAQEFCGPTVHAVDGKEWFPFLYGDGSTQWAACEWDDPSTANKRQKTSHEPDPPTDASFLSTSCATKTTRPVRRHCSVCGAYFWRPHDLKRHIRAVHGGEKPHKCNVCGRAFSRAADVDKHVQSVHCPEKKHACSICNMRFSRSDNLVAHVAAVHAKRKLHRCNVCDAEFFSRSKLNRHARAVHKSTQGL